MATAASTRPACARRSAWTAPDLDAQLDAIKAPADDVAEVKSTPWHHKTDQLTFTVANTVNANITHVIADAVRENGSDDTNWGGQP